MLEKIKRFIEKNQLISSKEPIICATSGGVDSICLIHILHDLGYPVILAHVNHHKRKESELEEQSMKNLAKELNIPFEVYSYYDTHQDNFQAKAHEARYYFFIQIAKKYHTHLIATAHHLDDQAETVLMRLLSGSNLYGYAGISISLTIQEMQIIRPLLCVSKDELYAYAKKNDYVYFEDVSNQSDDYLRNRIRHHIIPKFKEENQDFLNKLQEFSIQTKEAFEFIRNQSIKYLELQNNNIEVKSFISLPIGLKKDIICLLLEQYNIPKNQEIILKCYELIHQNQNKRIMLKNNFYFQIEYGKAFIKEQSETEPFYKEIDIQHDCVLRNRYHFYFSKNLPQNNAKYMKLCYNNLKLPFFIRNMERGDFIEINGGSKKVSRIFIDQKIPKDARKEIPLIFNREGVLLWVYPNVRNKDVFKEKETGDIYLVCEEIKYDK